MPQEQRLVDLLLLWPTSPTLDSRDSSTDASPWLYTKVAIYKVRDHQQFAGFSGLSVLMSCGKLRQRGVVMQTDVQRLMVGMPGFISAKSCK